MGNKRVLVAACVVGSLLVGCGVSPSINSTPSFPSPATTPQSEQDSSQGDDEGIWFDEEPADPLEKLVYASQRFVGDPLELRLLEGEGVDPAFVGAPDICDPQMVERVEALGIMQSETMPSYLDDRVQVCNFRENSDPSSRLSLSINRTSFPLENAVTKTFSEDQVQVGDGLAGFECVAFKKIDDHQPVYASFVLLHSYFDTGAHCQKAKLVLQLFLNVLGDQHAEIR